MPIFRYQPIAASPLPPQIKEPVSSRKISSYEYEKVSRYQFFAAGAPCIFTSHIFWPKPLKPVLVT
jgi:hypothetical protein